MEPASSIAVVAAALHPSIAFRADAWLATRTIHSTGGGARTATRAVDGDGATTNRARPPAQVTAASLLPVGSIGTAGARARATVVTAKHG
jgi:hypothetical protein